MINPDEVAERLDHIRSRISHAGVDPDSVRIIAVTKKFGPDAVHAAVAAGLRDVAENYAQEARAKNDAVLESDLPQVHWHFVGQLQRNKVKMLTSFIDLWQSVDSISLADEIAKRAPGARILVQVDLAEQPGRGGCAWDEVEGIVSHARANGLGVSGLMGVAPIGTPEEARPHFRRLTKTAADLGLTEVSMGMTADLEVAVQEGATMLRIGSALFGNRPVNGVHEL